MQTTCDADGTWSNEPANCTISKCNDPKVEIPVTNSRSVGECNMTYGSSCSLVCLSGFRSSGTDIGRLVCDVDDDGTAVTWKITGGAFSCVDNGKSISYPLFEVLDLFYINPNQYHLRISLMVTKCLFLS